MEKEAALRIQRWWRMISAQQLIVVQVRQEFEELCQELGDQKPQWRCHHFCLPQFQNPPQEVNRLLIEQAIAGRLAALKYDAFLDTARA
jgi:hypothetical protein